jgi:outer membrane protein OmpA-like peptidoglycan-associated protein
MAPGPKARGQTAEISHILGRGTVQPKLKIGAPNDVYEREADRVADQVMAMPDAAVAQRVETGTVQPLRIQRTCPECEGEQELQRQLMEEEDLQAKEMPGQTPQVTLDLESRINSLKGRGRPLSGSERRFFEPRFGASFSNVRVHDDTRVASVARSINARAFTFGRDVVFGAGEYAPDASSGKKLLAHELTHVVQQNDAQTLSPAYVVLPPSIRSGPRAPRGPPAIQRADTLESDPATAPGMTCDVATSSPAGVSLDVTFDINSSTLSAEDKAAVSNFVRNWHLTAVAEPVRVDGYASIDGPPSINWPLSCRRGEILANELMTPSDGSPGIPASNIEVFAQGETAQFSSALGPNRRAQAHIPSAPIPPPPCPAGFKTITVDFIKLAGVTRSPATDLAEANNIYKPCCVNFVVGQSPSTESEATTKLWLGGDTDLNLSGITCSTPTTEEKTMYDEGTKKYNLTSRMRVFYPGSTSGYVARAFSRPPYCAGGYSHHAVIYPSASNDTLAHEFGHILLNNRVHAGVDNPADNKNLMFAPGRTGSDLDATQCATIYSNA